MYCGFIAYFNRFTCDVVKYMLDNVKCHLITYNITFNGKRYHRVIIIGNTCLLFCYRKYMTVQQNCYDKIILCMTMVVKKTEKMFSDIPFSVQKF